MAGVAHLVVGCQYHQNFHIGRSSCRESGSLFGRYSTISDGPGCKFQQELRQQGGNGCPECLYSGYILLNGSGNVSAIKVTLIKVAMLWLVVLAAAPAWSQQGTETRLNSSHVRISYAVFCLK